jgi:two-component system sensor histidine kinase CiaH
VFIGIRRRLLGWNLLVLGLILIAVGIAVYIMLSHSLMAEVDRNLASRSDAAGLSLHDLDEHDLALGREGFNGGVFYLVASPSGQIIANPQSVNLSALPPNLFSGSRNPYQTIEVGDDQDRVYISTIRVRDGATDTLLVGQSLAPEERALHRMLLGLFIGGGIGLALSLIGASFLAGRALVPIEAAFQRQQQFIADASHELRTPLTILHSATDLLDQHRAEPLQQNGELFDDIREEILRLERLSGDLLTLARSDLGELGLAVAPLDLLDSAQEAVQRVQPMAAEVGVTVAVDRKSESLEVEADPDRLHQVLLILLDNAIKHTPPAGEVRVSARRHGTEALLEVVDTGDGIPPDQIDQVFNRFVRADASRSRAVGGAGLGLAIAKSLVEAHGGVMSLTSTLGVGTRVTVRLPLLEFSRLDQISAWIGRHPLRGERLPGSS